MGSTFKIVSLNVAGLVNSPKRRQIAKFLKKKGAGVTCLQETYLYKTEERYLAHLFRESIFHLASREWTKGVMIGISTVVPWVSDEVILDKEGHYVILKGKVNSQRLLLVGVYAPNRSQDSFGEEVYGELLKDPQYALVMLGDFSAILDS